MLAFADANRVAVSKRMAVDGKVFVDDVESCVVIAATAKVAIPSVEREKNFGVVLGWIIFRFDVEKTELAGVGAAFQIASGHSVSMVPACAGTTGVPSSMAPST